MSQFGSYSFMLLRLFCFIKCEDVSTLTFKFFEHPRKNVGKFYLIHIHPCFGATLDVRNF